MITREFIQSKFNIPLKCFGHCDKEATLRFIHGKNLTSCVVCPAGYVSRIIMYDADLPDMKSFISSLGIEVRDQDLRLATRHPWDLADNITLREVYWTQNYRRGAENNPQSLFICSRCSNFFMQPLHSSNILCSSCGN